MRLLNAATGEFVWVEDPLHERYAILSHVWSREPGVEQTYDDLFNIQEEVRIARIFDPTPLPADEVLRRASPKIRNACRYALSDGLPLIWIGAPCINKASSAELSEAINSMYEWYRLSTVCYAFLHDVDADEDLYEAASSFRRSTWHTRGWTLQELIAPATVVFLSSDWRMIGGKHRLADVLQEATGIDVTVLTHSRPLDTVAVARRMFWASKRRTTRKEDGAYCLMGIFNVHIPIIYGEGQKAFLRLQEEILRQIPDQSIFAWYRKVSGADIDVNIPDDPQGRSSLLATSSTHFFLSGDIKPIPRDVLARRLGVPELPPTTYIVTSEGIRVTLPLRPFAPSVDIGVLACEDAYGNLLGLVLRQTKLAFVRCVGAPLENPAFLDQSSQIITNHPSIYVYPIPALSIDTTTEHTVSEVYIVYHRSLSMVLRPQAPVTVQSSQPFKLVFSPSKSTTPNKQFTYAFTSSHTLVEPAVGNAATQIDLESNPDPDHGAIWDTLSYTLRISGTHLSLGWSFEVEFRRLQCTAHEADHWSSLAARTTFVVHDADGLEVAYLHENPPPEQGGDPKQSCTDHVHSWEAPSDYLRTKHFLYQNIGAGITGWRDGDSVFELSVTLRLHLEHPGNDAYPTTFSLSANHRAIPTLVPMRCSTPYYQAVSLLDDDYGNQDWEPHLCSAVSSNFTGDGPVTPINYGQCNLRDALDQNLPESTQADGLVAVCPSYLSDFGATAQAAPVTIRLLVINRAEYVGRISLNRLAEGQIIWDQRIWATRGMLATAIAREVKKFLERERARGVPLRYGEREVQLEDLVLVNVEQSSSGVFVPMLALSIADEQEPQ